MLLLLRFSFLRFLLTATVLLTLGQQAARAQTWQAALANATTGAGTISSRNVATDGNGNVYVVGAFTGTVRLGATTLVATTPTTTGTNGKDAFVAKWNAATNAWLWAVRGGGTSDDQATSVAVSGSSVYVGGYLLAANATFAGLPLGTPTVALNLFVVKLTDNGSSCTAAWAQTTATTSNYSATLFPGATALAVSGSSVYVAGQFSGPTMAFGGTTLTNAGGTTYTNDAFVAKLTDTGTAGAWQWASRAGGADHDQATSLAVSGNRVYVGGYFGSTANFGPIALTNPGTAGTTDAFVARLSDAGGAFEWALRTGGEGDDRANALAVNGSTVYLAGNARSRTLSFAPLTLTTPTGEGVRELFVAKLDDAGASPAFAWVERAGGAPVANLTGLAVNGSALYVTGDFLSATALRFGAFTLANPGTLNDVFVARLDDAGSSASYAWAHQMSTSGADLAAGIAVDATAVYASGLMRGSLVDFDGAPALQLSAGGTDNCVLGQLSPTGTWQQAQQAFVGGGFLVDDIAVDDCGFVYVAGSFSGQVRLGSTQLGSVGGGDVLVAKWNPFSSTWVWAVRAGGPGGELVTGLATNNAGQLYLTGTFSNATSGTAATTATFGPTVLTNTNGIGRDAFVAKLTDNGTSGTFGWACAVASTSDENLTAVVANGTSVYVAGYFDSQYLNFGSIRLSATSDDDVMVGKLTDLGTSFRVDWAMRAGGYFDDRATSLALNGNRLYVAGRYTSTTSSLADAFVARITDVGTPAAFDWLLLAPGNNFEETNAVAVSGSNVYIAGHSFSTSIAFGNVQLANTTLNNNQYDEGFVAGLTDNGASATFRWAQRVGGGNLSSQHCDALTASGNHVYVGGGYAGGNATFGSRFTLTNQGDYDAFVGRLTEVGATTSFDWVQRVSGSGAEYMNGLEVKANKVYAFGMTSTTNGTTLGNPPGPTVTLNGIGPILAQLTDPDRSASMAGFAYVGAVYCRTAPNPVPAITGKLGGTFAATPAGLVLDATTGLVDLTASTAGTYTVTYAVAGICPATESHALTVVNAASATFAYPAGALCAGSGAPVAATMGSGASAGRFTSTAGLALDATTGAVNPAASTAGTYTVTNTVAAANGCAAVTATAPIVINAVPVATLTAASATTLCQGEAVVLTAAGGSTYQFLLGGVSLPGATSPTYSATAPGTYSVVVTSTAGCTATSAGLTVVVNPRPAAPTLTAQYNGSTTTLTSSVTVGNQFYLNGRAIAGATAQTYAVNGTPAQLGTYTVTATSAAGCTSAQSAPLVLTASARPLAGTSLLLYPNPSPDGNLTLVLSGYRQAAELTVLNALGQVVYTRALVPAAGGGTTTQVLPLTSLAKGVYLLRVETPGGLDGRRIVID